MVAGIRPSLTSEKAKVVALDRHGHVAGGDDARPAAHGRALDQGHGQGRDVVERLEHVGQAHGVVAVVALGPVRRVAHPVQVGPGAECAARAANEHRAHMVGAVQGLERLAQGGDGRGVEGVLLCRPVDGDEHHAVGGGVDHRQLVVGVRRGARHQRMVDAVHLGGLGVGDVQGVEVFGGLGHVLLHWNYILNTPKVVSGIGAFRLALMARPRTSRVWAGSMTPSSHRRAVA